MSGDLWKRPSVVVVGTAVVIVVAFAWRGDLAVQPPAAKNDVAKHQPPERGPVVVRPDRPARPRAEAPTKLQGRVFDTMGFLVVGAEVLARGADPVRTDADGVFRVEVAEANTPLFVRARGHRSQWLMPGTGSPDGLLVQLAPAAPWDTEPAAPAAAPFRLFGEGVVRDAEGKPLAGAFVTAAGSGVWSRTDEIGRYSLPLPSATPTLLVHCPDSSCEGRGQAVRSEPLQLGRERGIVPLPELVAAPASALRGTLRDGRGNPLVGVPLQVRGEGLSRVVESGLSGMFRLAGLSPGRYEVAPVGYRGALGVRQEVVVDRGFVDCELQLQTTSEQRVQVLDEHGTPVKGAYVAVGFDGERRGVTRVDGEGWTAVQLGGQPSFEVRAADGHVELPVRSFEATTGRLVVAAP